MDPELSRLINADVASKTTDLTKDFGFAVFFTSVDAMERSGNVAMETHAHAMEEFREKGLEGGPLVQIAQMGYKGPPDGFNALLSPPPGLYYLVFWKRAEEPQQAGASVAERVTTRVEEIYSQARVEGTVATQDLNVILLSVYPRLKEVLRAEGLV
jgi:hypothetical protein